jgi:hypothetical protein
MQKPAEMHWGTPRCMGDLPSRRSGKLMQIFRLIFIETEAT